MSNKWRRDPKILTRISKFASALLPNNDKLNIRENKMLIDYTQNINVLPGVTDDEFVMQTAMGFYKKITALQVEKPIVLKDVLTDIINEKTGDINDTALGVQLYALKDIKRTQKIKPKITNLTGVGGLSSMLSVVKTLNPEAAYKHTYIVLDNKYATYSDNNTKLKWNFMETLQEDGKSTNIVGKIRDIVSIKIHSCILPNPEFSSTMNRATICIHEWESQAFIAPNGRKFHAITSLVDLEYPVPIDLRSVGGAAIYNKNFVPDFATLGKYELLSGFRQNDGIFNFNEPITTINSLTLSFGNPFTAVSLPRFQYFNCELTDYDFDFGSYGKLVIQTDGDHYLQGKVPHPGTVQEWVYSLKIIDFTTTDTVLDALIIDYFNTNEFTSVEVQSSNELYINLKRVQYHSGEQPVHITFDADMTGLVDGVDPTYTMQGTPSKFTIQLDTYRMFVTMEVTHKSNKLDNDY